MQFKNVAFIDTETTGLNPEVNEIIELYISSFDENGKNECYHFYFSFDKSLANPKALEINRYHERKSEWKGCTSFYKSAQEIFEILKKKDVVGHNIYFDVNFLKESFKRAGYKRYPWKRTIDTYAISRFVLEDYQIKHSLDSLRDFFGISSSNNHTAKKDVDDLILVWKHLKMYQNSFLFRSIKKITWKFFKIK